MAISKDSETSIRHNPFWVEEVNQFCVEKYEMNQNNKDLYFWVIDRRHFDADIFTEDATEVDEGKLKNVDKKKLLGNEILVRIVGADYNDHGTRRRYIGAALFYEFKEKKWDMVARLNVLKYAQVKDRPSRRIRLTKPVDKLGAFDEVLGEIYWDKETFDFKPGLIAYHEENLRGYREYAGILGAIILYSEAKIIQNEAIRFPVTYLNSLMDISFDLLHTFGTGSVVSASFVPK